ncbi:hypothetical protein RKD30_002772 [Streptomyces pristinaespiralis]
MRAATRAPGGRPSACAAPARAFPGAPPPDPRASIAGGARDAARPCGCPARGACRARTGTPPLSGPRSANRPSPPPARGCGPGPSGPPAPGAGGHAPAQTACRARQGTSGPPGGEGRRPAQAARGRGRGCPRLERPATDTDAPLERSSWHGRRLARVRPGQAARRAWAAALPAERLAGAGGDALGSSGLPRTRTPRSNRPPGTDDGLPECGRGKRPAGHGRRRSRPSGSRVRAGIARLERPAKCGRCPARTARPARTGMPSFERSSWHGRARPHTAARRRGPWRPWLERPVGCGRGCSRSAAFPARTGTPPLERRAWRRPGVLPVARRARRGRRWPVQGPRGADGDGPRGGHPWGPSGVAGGVRRSGRRAVPPSRRASRASP